jgi:hypothetical protein
LKRRFLQEPHSVTSQKTPFFIYLAILDLLTEEEFSSFLKKHNIQIDDVNVLKIGQSKLYRLDIDTINKIYSKFPFVFAMRKENINIKFNENNLTLKAGSVYIHPSDNKECYIGLIDSKCDLPKN